MRRRSPLLLALALVCLMLVWVASPGQSATSGGPGAAATETLESEAFRPHQLPDSLTSVCQAPAPNYFEAIRGVSVGYLLWTQFPIRLSVEPLTNAHEAQVTRWQEAVASAVADWNQYLPIAVTGGSDADIRLRPVMPPLRRSASGELRAQSGEARYEIYRKSSGTLAHRFEVMVKPGQATRQLEATLRHELGHALGLWGHSRNPEDALYYSQVSAPPAVSQRDVATLCQVYQQPTALGWPQANSGR